MAADAVLRAANHYDDTKRHRYLWLMQYADKFLAATAEDTSSLGGPHDHDTNASVVARSSAGARAMSCVAQNGSPLIVRADTR